ncbi:MAG: EF-P beta-lysylation protein EpmB [Proteobacteria bacterium]|nr:EF-P beta-lysylation protein EpmB [Pseudomonadota bacterium]
MTSSSKFSIITENISSLYSADADDNSAAEITGNNGDGGWKKELANATTSAGQLLKKLQLERYSEQIDKVPDFRCLVTDSYLRKITAGDIDDPLLRQVLPLAEENDREIQLSGITDPVGDIDAGVTRGLLQKYHGRALLISTGACAIHCRYCFRRLYPYQQLANNSSVLAETLSYLKHHADIDEIILSGGDPLVLDNEKLAALIDELEGVPQIQTLRIHTRLPVVLPARIDKPLLRILQDTRFQVVMVIHANHARELGEEEYHKLHQLAESGITLLNQSVLLKGVNDDIETLSDLSKRLFQCRTLPYYLHLLDPVKGAMHFQVEKKTAIGLIEQMTIQLPGYLVPKLVQEITGMKSKTAISHI